MSITTPTITTADLFTMPEDGIERDLIRGELREYPMTRRSREHSRVLARVTSALVVWADSQSDRKLEVATGEAGVRLRRDPESTVGIDAALFTAESVASMPKDQAWYEGPPVLAVEVLSPSDTHERVVEKINLYLECGVTVVWILDPDFQTLTIYRSKQKPQLLGVGDNLDGLPELAGLNVAVSEFFK